MIHGVLACFVSCVSHRLLRCRHLSCHVQLQEDDVTWEFDKLLQQVAQDMQAERDKLEAAEAEDA